MFFHKCSYVRKDKIRDYYDMWDYFSHPCFKCKEENKECFMLSNLIMSNSKRQLETIFILPNNPEGILIAEIISRVFSYGYKIATMGIENCKVSKNLNYGFKFLDKTENWDIVPYASKDTYNPILENKESSRFYVYINTTPQHNKNFILLNYNLEQISINMELFINEKIEHDYYGFVKYFQNIIADYNKHGDFFKKYIIQHKLIGNQHSFSGVRKTGWVHNKSTKATHNDFINWCIDMMWHKAYLYSEIIDDVFVVKGIDEYDFIDEYTEYLFSNCGLCDYDISYAKMANKTQEVKKNIYYTLMKGKIYKRDEGFRLIDGEEMYCYTSEVKNEVEIEKILTKLKR
jgi:hypothetical protein